MSDVDSYIREVLDHLPPGSPDRERIAADLRAHIEESIAAGEAPEIVMERMGSPREVAEEWSRGRELPYASRVRRLAAAIVDYALLASVAALLIYGGFLVADAGDIWFVWMCIMAASLFPLAYFWLAEGLTRRTVGKWLFGLAVADEHGGAVSMRQAFVRRLSIVFSGALALDALILLFTRKKQRGLDMVAHTVVLQGESDVPALWSWLSMLAAIVMTCGIWASLISRLI